MKLPTLEYLNRVKLERSRPYRLPNPFRKERRLSFSDMKGWQQFREE